MSDSAHNPATVVDVRLLSAALDEIYRLRRALAYESGAIEAHLELRVFPKSRRFIAERQVERMRDAARGFSERAYAEVPPLFLRTSFRHAGADETFTRSQFEREVARDDD